ncbi:hypothetical protein, partial [Accumulibacter sp.]|uniref:hypothetical protein n=1 Tax=Accumulibacter sp. TaxID=2053492 RepID=UPI00257C32FA
MALTRIDPFLLTRPDPLRQRRNPMPAEDAVLKVLPEGQSVLAAGFLEAGEGVAAAAAGLAT